MTLHKIIIATAVLIITLSTYLLANEFLDVSSYIEEAEAMPAITLPPLQGTLTATLDGQEIEPVTLESAETISSYRFLEDDLRQPR